MPINLCIILLSGSHNFCLLCSHFYLRFEIHNYACKNKIYTVQLNLNLIEHMCSMGSTWHAFISHACKPACARKIDDVKPTIQSSCVRTRCVHDSLQMHTCMSGMHTPNLDYACIQIVSQGQQNKLYNHVHVLRCNPPRDAIRKSC